MKQQFLPTNVQEVPEILMDDDIDVAIVKLMSSFKGYTTNEVYDLLKDKVHDPDAIRPTMLALHTNGFFDHRQLPGTPSVVYVLRSGRTVETLQADTKRPTRIRKYKMQTTPVIDPAGRVLLSDGIDVAVWKVMQDRRWRSIKNIVALLWEFGFERAAVDRRLDALIRNNQMFDRSGYGATRAYRLKPHVRCPIPADVSKEKMLVEQISTEQPEAPTQEEVMAETKPAADVKKAIITNGDTLPEAIWKIMIDHAEYSVSDLALLLSDYGFRYSQVSPVMTTLFQGGFFERREIERPGKVPYYLYKLKPNMEQPPKTKRAARAVAKVSEPAAPAAPVETQPVPKEPEMTDTAAKPAESMLKVVTPTNEAPKPLLDVAITIKGVSITIAQFAQLYQELRAQGLANLPPKSNSLIEATYTIENASFTRQELFELVEKMNNTARNFQKAFDK